MHFFFANALRCRHSPNLPPDIFFWKINGIYSYSLFLKLTDRKNSILKRFLFCFICKLLVTETCNSRVFPYINIGHHTSSKHWPAGNFMKNESIRAYYRSTLRGSSIKKDYWHELFPKTFKKLNSWLPRQVQTRRRCHRLLWITGCDTQYKSPEERKSAKFSQAACLAEDSWGTDADADLPGESQSRTAWAKTGQRWEKVLQEATAGIGGGQHGDVWQGCENDE